MGAPRHCLGAPDLLEQRDDGLGKSYMRTSEQAFVQDPFEELRAVIWRRRNDQTGRDC